MEQEDKILKNRLGTKHNPNIRNEVLGMCWDYLNQNFHKFSEANKIMIATKLCSKEVQGPLVDQSHHHTINFIKYSDMTEEVASGNTDTGKRF